MTSKIIRTAACDEPIGGELRAEQLSQVEQGISNIEVGRPSAAAFPRPAQRPALLLRLDIPCSIFDIQDKKGSR